ncbi:MAG TPA: hypothetical protein VGM75_30150 [Pseudonocardiaceae bacterium]
MLNTSYSGGNPDFDVWLKGSNNSLPTLPPPGTKMDTITGVFDLPQTKWR